MMGHDATAFADVWSRDWEGCQRGRMGFDIATTLPRASRATIWSSLGTPPILMVVSRPFQATVRTGESFAVLRPARMRQRATSVAPFQIAWTVVFRRPAWCAIAVGRLSGWPVHWKR